jgi:hypothetical protein
MGQKMQSFKGRSGTGGLAMAAAVALAAIAFPPRVANATLELTIGYGTSAATTIIDNMAGTGDTDPAAGEIVTTNNLGITGLSVSINVASSNSPGTAGGVGILNINSLDITNNSSGAVTLTLLTTDVGFAVPGALPNAPMSLMSSFAETSGAGTGTATFHSFADPGNGQPLATLPTGPVSTALQSDNLAPSFNDTASPVSWALSAAPGPYSLASVMTFTVGVNSNFDLTGTTTATPVVGSLPEPTFGVVPVLAFGLLARRRRNASNAV